MGQLFSALGGGSGGGSALDAMSPAIANNPISPLFAKLTTPDAKTGMTPLQQQGRGMMQGMGIGQAIGGGAQGGAGGQPQSPLASAATGLQNTMNTSQSAANSVIAQLLRNLNQGGQG